MSKSYSQELPYVVNLGVDTYSPALSAKDLKFCRLSNIQPRLNRLITANGLHALQELAGASSSSSGSTSSIQVLAFASYTHPTSLYSGLYAITNTSVYAFDFTTSEFGATPIFTGFPDNTDQYSVVPWFDCVYVTKLGLTVKLAALTATIVTTMPSARYAMASSGHMMMANIRSPSGKLPNTIINSDLYLPERFVIDTDSEADYFEMEASDGEITGLSYQRGNNLIYTRKSIWLATYRNGKYTYDPLFSGIGNVYHGAQVRVKEVDMFIGDDGIYVIDGLQLRSIGDPIWTFFKSEVFVTSLASYVTGRVDQNNFEVSWTYPRENKAPWSIVYNYKEDKWSDRDPQDISASVHFDAPLRGFAVINSFSDVINSGAISANMIDGEWQYTTYGLKDLYGTLGGVIGVETSPDSLVSENKHYPFSVGLEYGVVFPVSVETLVAFDYVYSNLYSVFDVSSSLFTASVAGWYTLTNDLLLLWSEVSTEASAVVTISIRKNGTDLYVETKEETSLSETQFNYQAAVFLNAGDTIGVFVSYSLVGTATCTASTDYTGTRFAGVRTFVPFVKQNVNEAALNVLLETFDFYFEETEETKELSKMLLQFAEVNDADIKLSICSRHTLSNEMVWSAPITLTRFVAAVKQDSSYFFRNLGVGKFIRFRFTIANYGQAALSELYVIAPFLLIKDK